MNEPYTSQLRLRPSRSGGLLNMPGNLIQGLGELLSRLLSGQSRAPQNPQNLVRQLQQPELTGRLHSAPPTGMWAQEYPALMAATKKKPGYDTANWPTKYPALQAAIEAKGKTETPYGIPARYLTKRRKGATKSTYGIESWPERYPVLQRALQGAPQELKDDVEAAIENGATPEEVLR